MSETRIAYSRLAAGEILGLIGIESANSTVNIGPGPVVCAVVGGASASPASPIQ